MTLLPPKKVILAAGGTGGHMFPAQALARELIARGIEVALITDKRGGGFGPELSQVETHHISAGGVAGTGLTKRLHSFVQLGLGYLSARRLIRGSGADAVVGFGGYASVPTVLAGAHLGRRIVLHEQNSVLGRANRLLARRANAIATSFNQVFDVAAAHREKITITGNPVRAKIEDLGNRPYGVPDSGDVFRLLVVGGSQGARVFNEIVPAAIGRLPADLRARLVVSQQVPGQALAEVAAAYDSCGVRHDLAPYFADVPERLAAAHLVISRSGASTVAELAAAGRPAILVPYPHATDDHQTRNAQALSTVGGGWLMLQSDLTAASLAERLTSLLASPALLTRAARRAHAAAHRDAARRLADVVCGQRGANGDERHQEAAA
jgi:UDP-N-acetylglucosamine--N-acetylmuramyl-(pentapeptide) pyrophosphoryl-undecaprenol N-acetylglucosamine transferase